MLPWNEPLFDRLKRDADRLPHALLILGARGTGKLALAEHIAQFLLCEHGSADARPCGACDGCRWFIAGSHPDLRRVEPEALARRPEAGEEGEAPAKKAAKPSTEIKVEQVRELANFLNVVSHRGRLRVALVHPAEEMNANAANALLKGLEEPPPGAVFVLVSHHAARLLPTIRSRCVALPVALPPRTDALRWLGEQGVADAERWLAYAGGAPLTALEYSTRATSIERLLQQPSPVDQREDLEMLAEALQKMALDRAFFALGLPPKYRTPLPKQPSRNARAWLAFARRLGEERLLARHPLNAKLFSTQLLAEFHSLQ